MVFKTTNLVMNFEIFTGARASNKNHGDKKERQEQIERTNASVSLKALFAAVAPYPSLCLCFASSYGVKKTITGLKPII
jgi:hypothetical protein